MLKRRSKSALHRSAIHRAALVEALERRILLSDTITAVQGQNFDAGDIDGTGNVFIPAGVSVTATQIRENSLTVSGNLTMDFAAAGVFDPSHASVVNSLTLATNTSTGAYLGTLNLNNDVLIIRAGTNTYDQQYSILLSLEAAITHAYDNGAWDGTGITTSAAKQYGQFTGGIGSMINNTATNGSNGGPAFITFNGQPVSQNDIILTYDALGDRNLTGVVNYSDYQTVSANINDYGTWSQGDFDTPGPIAYRDVQIVSGNINAHIPQSPYPQAPLTAPQFLDTFSDPTTPDPAANLSSTINWDDGSADTAGAIVDDLDGTFDVFGSHTFTQSGTFTSGEVQSFATGNTTPVADDILTSDVTASNQVLGATGLTATENSSNLINLDWTDPSDGLNAYTVEERTDSSGWSTLTNTFAGATDFAVTNAFTASANYYFQVVVANNSSLTSNIACATATNDIADGSFEYTGVGTSTQQLQPVSPFWTFTGNSGIESNDSSIAAPTAPDGIQAAFVQTDGGSGNGDGSISQFVNLNPGTYTLSFQAAAATNSTPAEPLILSLDGTTVGTFTPTSSSFTAFSVDFNVATAGSHMLSISGADSTTTNQITFIDLAALTQDFGPSITLANGNLQQPAVSPDPGFSLDPPDSGWTFTGNAGLAIPGPATYYRGPTPPNGQNQVAYLETNAGSTSYGDGSMSQSVDFPGPGTYAVSFYLAPRVGSNPEPIILSLDGAAIGNPITPSSTSFTQVTELIPIASAGSQTIEFSAQDAGTSDQTTFITDVAFVALASNPSSMPTVATAASADSSSITGTTADLSVLGALSSPDADASDLTYTWSVQSGPTGFAVSFTDNNDNSAQNTVATFDHAGEYTLTATIAFGSFTVTSNVTVNVLPTPTTISITPGAPMVGETLTQQLTATEFDQFSAPMATQPNFTWSVVSGGGTVTLHGGLFTAPSQPGTIALQAQDTAAGLARTDQLTVVGDLYQVQITGQSAADEEYEGGDFYNLDELTGNLTVTNTGWISAATPQQAVEDAISGTVTVTIPQRGTTATVSFPTDMNPYGFTLSVAPDTADPNYTGSIGMTDGSGTADDWDFYWSLAITAKPNSLAVSLGDGNNDLLMASADGTQNLEPMYLNIPSGTPTGTQLTLSTSSSSVDVWDTDDPGDEDSPLIDGSNSSTTWTLGTDTVPTELWAGATAASQSVGDTVFTLAAALPAGNAQTAPSNATTLPSTRVAIFLQSAPDGAPPTGNIAGQTQNWLIGEDTILYAAVVSPQQFPNATYLWHLPANTDYRYTTTLTTGQLVPVPPTQTVNGATTGYNDKNVEFFWTQPTGVVAATVSVDVTINGKTYSARTNFNVQAPTFNPGQKSLGPPQITPDPITGAPDLASNNVIGGSVTGQPGEWGFLQLVKTSTDITATDNTKYSWSLDNQLVNDSASEFPYGMEDPTNPNAKPVEESTGAQTYNFTDSPGQDDLNAIQGFNVLANSRIKTSNWQLYVIYQPPGVNSQWVPIEELNWQWAFSVSHGPTGWDFTQKPPPPPKITSDWAAVTTALNWSTNWQSGMNVKKA